MLDTQQLESSLSALQKQSGGAGGKSAKASIPTVQWDDIGGLIEAKREILGKFSLTC